MLISSASRLQPAASQDGLSPPPSLCSTFEFEQLVSQIRPRQLVDSVRHRVLVVERLVAGVHDGGAVQEGHLTNAVAERKHTCDMWVNLAMNSQQDYLFPLKEQFAYFSPCL